MEITHSARAILRSYLDFDVDAYVGDRKSRGTFEPKLAKDIGEWFELHRSARMVSRLLALFAFLLVFFLNYDLVTGWTSNGRPWTHIMRETWWYYAAPTALLLVLAFALVSRTASGRLGLFVTLYLLGFLGGHIFWFG